jgi:hypothetical protein
MKVKHSQHCLRYVTEHVCGRLRSKPVTSNTYAGAADTYIQPFDISEEQSRCADIQITYVQAVILSYDACILNI